MTTKPSIFPHAPPSRILFGPGPINIHPLVLEAMSSPLVGHLDPYFVKLMEKIQELLRWVWRTENEITVPISGTGSAAMEAAVANLVEPGDVVLVGVNGYFGSRLAEMARRYGGRVVELKKKWGESFSFSELCEAVERFQPKILGLVHAETSTGAKQNVEGVADFCHDNGCLLLLDTVTSMGGIPVLIDEWGVDAAYSCTQKCLGCSPGLSPLTFSPRAMEKIDGRKSPPATWYLDIKLLFQYWGGRGSYHHTAPISMNYGLYQALLLIHEEGLEERWERHQRVGRKFCNGIEALGLTLNISNPDERLPQLTTIQVPEGVDPNLIIKGLRDKYNIAIAGGLGELSGKIWRVGFMGYNATEENVDTLLHAFNDILTTTYPKIHKHSARTSKL